MTTTEIIATAFLEANPELDEQALDNTEVFEQTVFDHACLLNKELTKKMSFNIAQEASFYVNRQGRLIISYRQLDNVDDFKRLAAIYETAYPGIDALVTDESHFDNTQKKELVYFALSFDAQKFLEHIPQISAKTISSSNSNPVKLPEEVAYKSNFRSGFAYSTKSELSAKKTENTLYSTQSHSMFAEKRTKSPAVWELSRLEMVILGFIPVVGWAILLAYAGYRNCCLPEVDDEAPLNPRNPSA